MKPRRLVKLLRERDGDGCQMGGWCVLPGEPVAWKRWELRWNRAGQVPADPTIDHVVPVSRGGPADDPANMRVAHRICNNKRGNEVVIMP